MNCSVNSLKLLIGEAKTKTKFFEFPVHSFLSTNLDIGSQGNEKNQIYLGFWTHSRVLPQTKIGNPRAKSCSVLVLVRHCNWKDLSNRLKFMAGVWESRTELCIRSHIYSYYLKTIGQEDKEERAVGQKGKRNEKRWESR